jgi:hypothetical protein
MLFFSPSTNTQRIINHHMHVAVRESEAMDYNDMEQANPKKKLPEPSRERRRKTFFFRSRSLGEMLDEIRKGIKKYSRKALSTNTSASSLLDSFLPASGLLF